MDSFTPDVNQYIDSEEEHIATLSPDDRSVRDAIIRSIQDLLDDSPITMEVLEAYQQATTPEQSSLAGLCVKKPTWDEMQAGFLIERCIRHIYKSSPNTWITKMTPPSKAFERLRFHSLLASMRVVEENASELHKDQAMEEETKDEATVDAPKLPIDDHESTIIERIKKNRVTIIHGETGCGKSSRVPVMLLNAPPPDGSLRKVKFFISQPRRIAAKALVERVRACEPEHGKKFALRMGHGWKEYESKETQAYFVTTGYLVRLLANHPESFDDCTHLVIDEVHERSVDTDILCLLCRRLLENNKDIRLVLMSATLATKMYQDYFNVAKDPIHVGVRRFPITEFFIDDLEQFGLPGHELAAVGAIKKEIESKRCRCAPTSAELKNRHALAARLATIVGSPGTSVLIFVPGLAEIISISEYIESFHVAGVNFTCFPIHSDIPFEEQMGAFDEPAQDEVKIIIATNAAESSVTLPNVDNVICLGLCRQIIYNQASHRQMLTPAWISRASATQRAGRTGRVRPGSVYRLYSKNAFEHYLDEFEPGEMLRIPLDNTILMLKQLLHSEIKPVFRECLEPPALNTIDRSFQSLHHWNFITEPDDSADITSLGAFVSSLGVDLSLGSFIGLGIQFGVAAEAIEMAAMMSLPKTPFQLSSPLWMSPRRFNETASATYVAKAALDGGLCSEPLALMNALWDYTATSTKKQSQWCTKNRIAHKRWQSVVSSRNSLLKRVATFLGVKEERLQLQLPPRHMPREKLLLLRVIKLWVFSDSVIECAPSSLNLESDGSVSLAIKGKSGQNITREMLDQVLCSPERHPYHIVEFNESDQTGVFDTETLFSLQSFVPTFEPRLLSYASEKDITALLCHSRDEFFLYVNDTAPGAEKIMQFFHTVGGDLCYEDRFAYQYVDKKRRGFYERASGLWSIQDEADTKGEFSYAKQFRRYELTRSGCPDFDHAVDCTIHKLHFEQFESIMIWNFLPQGSKKKKKKATNAQPFTVSIRGQCQQVSKPDMQDLVGNQCTSISNNRKNSLQTIVVKQPASKPSNSSDGLRDVDPIIVDVPEGARVLAMLASGQRKAKNQLRFPMDSEDPDSEVTIDFAMKQEEVDVSKRWRRVDSDNMVYVDESSIPGSAIHTTSDLFAVAANSLELQRGGLRVDCLTLLPPNPFFVVISFLSFGLNVGSLRSWIAAESKADDEDSGISKTVSKAYTWLIQRTKVVDTKSNDCIVIGGQFTDDFKEDPTVWKKEKIKERLQGAALFHEEAKGMGESLRCFPEKTKELCQLFDALDDDTFSFWDQFDEEALTEENLSRWRIERKTSTSEVQRFKVPVADVTASQVPDNRLAPNAASTGKRPKNGRKKKSDPAQKKSPSRKDEKMEHHSVRRFDKDIVAQSTDWFSTNLGVGESMPAFPSTNILALLFQLYKEIALDPPVSANEARKFTISLNPRFWDVTLFRHKQTGKEWYKASLLKSPIPFLSPNGRGKNKLPKWIKKQHNRPTSIAEAKDCVPPNVDCPAMIEISSGAGLMFDSIQDALQMEAAFWLERQFCHAGKNSTQHWFMHPMDRMIQILRISLPSGAAAVATG
ncbi:MAG: hypothetical protein SGILL_004290 [Bacillariaceae sp.]